MLSSAWTQVLRLGTVASLNHINPGVSLELGAQSVERCAGDVYGTLNQDRDPPGGGFGLRRGPPAEVVTQPITITSIYMFNLDTYKKMLPALCILFNLLLDLYTRVEKAPYGVDPL